MGRLHYGNTTEPIDMPDRVLAHLKVVVTTKLRRAESFAISWRHGSAGDAARSTIWVHCSIPLRFDFDSGEAEILDRAYLDELAQSASSSGGVLLDLSDDAEVTAIGGAARLGRAA